MNETAGLRDTDEILKQAALLREREDDVVAEPELSVLCFRIESEHYAVPVVAVREILNASPISRVPGTQGHVLGVINLRSEIIPVVDARQRLLGGAIEVEKGGFQIVILKSFGEPLGMAVDAVEDMVTAKLIPSQEHEDHMEGKIRLDHGEGECRLAGLINLRWFFFSEGCGHEDPQNG